MPRMKRWIWKAWILFAAVALVLSVATFVTANEPAVARLALAVSWLLLACALLIILKRGLKRLIGGVMASSQDISDLKARIGVLNTKTDTLADYAGSNLRIARRLEKLETLAEDLRLSPIQSVSDESREFTNAAYSPQLIPSMAISAKPEAHSPGRLAASQVMKTELVSDDLLHRIITTENIDHSIKVIGSSQIELWLTTLGHVESVEINGALSQLDPHDGYFIIDENELDNTSWRGVLDASGTHTFMKLNALLDLARKNKTVVIVIESEMANHNSNLLRDKANIVISPSGRFTSGRWGEDVNLPVLTQCVEFVRGVTT